MVDSSAEYRALPSHVSAIIALNYWVQIASLTALFGSVFAFAFAQNADLASWWRFAGETITTQGVVLRTASTSMSVNKKRVLKITFQFQDQNARFHTCHSYGYRDIKSNQKVTVEYPVGRGEWGRIVGMRSQPFPAVLAIFYVAPLASAIFLILGWKHGSKLKRLLTKGQATTAKINHRSQTNVRINGRPVVRYDMELSELTPPVRVTYKTHEPMPPIGGELTVLVDPQNHDRIMPLEILLSQVGANPDGTFRPGHWQILVRLILPITVATTGVIFLILLLT